MRVSTRATANAFGSNWRFLPARSIARQRRSKDIDDGFCTRARPIPANVAGFSGGNIPCSFPDRRSFRRNPDLLQHYLVLEREGSQSHRDEDRRLGLRDSGGVPVLRALRAPFLRHLATSAE